MIIEMKDDINSARREKIELRWFHQDGKYSIIMF